MESNKEDSVKCISIAELSIQNGDIGKAKRFLEKAERLYPSDKAKELLRSLSDLSSSNGRPSTTTSDTLRSRKKSENKPDSPIGSYTAEQIQAVKKIKSCKDYYEILGLEKTASDSEIKKAYRKLALQFHPDKNKTPGASEAFTAIGNAFATLSDQDKRRKYDSVSYSSRTSNPYHDYHRESEYGFEAEEIFNMFFNEGSFYDRRRGPLHRTTFTHHIHRNQHEHPVHNKYASLIQLIPLLFLIGMSLFSYVFVSDPLYSFNRTNKYSIMRVTRKLQLKYFVKDTFLTDFSGSLKKFELFVEEEYINELTQACFKEKNYKENLLWQARYSGESSLLSRAHNHGTPKCDELKNIRDR